MPKTKTSYSVKLNSYIKKYGNDKFEIIDNNLFCKLCVTSLNATKLYYIDQHIASTKHQAAKNIRCIIYIFRLCLCNF